MLNLFDIKNVEDIPQVVVDSLNKTRYAMSQKEYNHWYYINKTKIKRQQKRIQNE